MEAAHPAQVVRRLDQSDLDHLLSDDEFVERVQRELTALDEATLGATNPTIAYLSPEFGVSGLVPQYAGGLGILAGDHLKTASDLGIPLAGVGLFYRDGVFRQSIEGAVQSEVYHTIPAPDFGAHDTGVVVQVPFPGRAIDVRVWRMDVGSVPLVLLDTDLDSNSVADRQITDRLYAGSRQHRIDQEMVLGIGGARALKALGWDVSVHHLNEGHAGFIVLELIDRVIGNGDLARALEEVRSGLVFTTHTPVPAGIDRFERAALEPYLATWAEAWDVEATEIWALGHDEQHPGQFNMAALCLRSASGANGVSKLHGEVSRRIFGGIGIGDRIGSITNGVHARTWTAPHIQEVFDDQLGPGWADGDSDAWSHADNIEETRLEQLRRQASVNLSRLVSHRTTHLLDPDALVLGFARRFAPYKRATLLLHDRERIASLLANDEKPIHIVVAGKAHPADEPGKALVREVIEFGSSEAARGRFTFIPDYDMIVAHAMVQGSDVWLNNPIRPREASGTSGEKAVLNGCLNCSILDGWWAEMYEPEAGWAVEASSLRDPAERDADEATAMLDAIAKIRDEYYGARPVFNGRIRHAWKAIGPKVTAARMLREYQERVYTPALHRTGI